MKMKTFRADTMNEALLMIKNELGPEAVILKTKKIKQSLLGKNKDVIEVTAALDENLYAKPIPKEGAGTTLNKNSEFSPQLDLKKEPKPLDSNQTYHPHQLRNRRVQSFPPQPSVEIQNESYPFLKEDLHLLLSKINRIEKSVEQLDYEHLPAELHWVYEYLVEVEMGELAAKEMVCALANVVPQEKRGDGEYLKKILSKILWNRLPEPGEYKLRRGRPNLIFIVGPTGVGKTTVLSKLCGVYKFEKKLNVGVISADYYKMGAFEQTQVMCHAMEVPFQPVYTEEDFEYSLKYLGNQDVIFVDTCGGTLNQKEKEKELHRWIEKYEPDAVSLVLSSTTRAKDLSKVCEHYQSMGADSLIFTKLDESSYTGCLYHSSAKSQLPLRYLCNGQEVPDNIFPADKQILSSLMLNGLNLSSQPLSSTL